MIEVVGVSKRFGTKLVLDRVSLSVPGRSIAVVLGPLGAGKSVLLRIAAGILAPDNGHVKYDGVELEHGALADNLQLTGRLGYVFQSGALFDSLDVWHNVSLPLEETTRLGDAEVGRRVTDALGRTGILDARKLLPGQLSGGMTRLVAIARALVTEPEYLFFDEPTSGLDPAMRGRVTELIRALRDAEGKTCVVVTHDLDTAHVLADVLYLLKNARLVSAERVTKEDYEATCA